MLDFLRITRRETSKGRFDIIPDFYVGYIQDLMIRGGAFYAIYDQRSGFWSENPETARELVDAEIAAYAEEYAEPGDRVLYLQNFSSNKWTEFQKYMKSMPDNYHDLNLKVVFQNDEITREDYVTRKLPYAIGPGTMDCYQDLMNTLYAESERRKLEWAIGCVISGDSKRVQKFEVLYGGPGTGKGTVLEIIQSLFPGLYAIFEAKELGKNSSQFAMESFKRNPLVGIQLDGDLSRIEDNTKLNTIVSHEDIMINEKFKNQYVLRLKTFLFMGTNRPVQITDAKSGILRRLIDVTPTGDKIPPVRYEQLKDGIRFELGAIAHHCLSLYNELGPNYYNGYVPYAMMSATNDCFNFVEDNLDLFLDIDEDGLVLRPIWKRYKEYCEDSNVKYPLPLRAFRSEMKNYFEEYKDRYNGKYSVYFGFKKSMIFPEEVKDSEETLENNSDWLKMEDTTTSELDDILKDYPAQYANDEDKPKFCWDNVKTKLKDIDPTKVHYVMPMDKLIVVDFDLKNEEGEKDSELNLKAASKWPITYAELSKGGEGIHLHYFYDGDVNELSRIFGPEVEIKVFTGKSSLRRRLSRCNNRPIATISSGLPLKERKKTVTSKERIQSEKGLRNMIERNMQKEFHPGTKPSMDFIYKILEDAYNSGMHYDVRDMRPALQNFAMNSTHQSDYCLRLLGKMKFVSELEGENLNVGEEAPIVFVDIEIFPNLFVVAYKKLHGVTICLINPSAEEVENLFQYRLIGFNNRKYDNHILWAASMGYTPEQLYRLSRRIIVEKDRNAFFREAYSISYTDVYDFLSAANKMTLKKWEIKLGIHHQEIGLRWDEPVPEELWPKVGEYCCNDVDATEETFLANEADWDARCILADWAEMTPNDTTNSLTTRLIVGNDRKPQDKFIYTDLSTIYNGYEFDPFGIDPKRYDEGVKIVNGKSIYRGEDPGEGGYVYAEPGMYTGVALLDIASMHPISIIKLKIFGEEYTGRFASIVQARLAIKHKDYELARTILPTRLWHYLDNPKKAKALANALKTAINSVYGLTSAKFENALRDPRNVDNIVAKYGALFMINLKHEVQDRGFTVVHIKTDSIKIANATPEIIRFVMDYGKEYGFTFEHEDTYSKLCLVNDAVYIARYAEPHVDDFGNEKWWTATGTQFQVPYVFKTLFSHEKLNIHDYIETKSVSSALYLDFNESLCESMFDKNGNMTPEDHPDRHDYRFIGKVGAFCPVKPGCGGGILLRETEPGKYAAATGTKKKDGSGVYRWMEYEMIAQLDGEKMIDESYYRVLADEAIDKINQYCDFEWFVSEDVSPNVESWMNIPIDADEEVPFDEELPKVA